MCGDALRLHHPAILPGSLPILGATFMDRSLATRRGVVIMIVFAAQIGWAAHRASAQDGHREMPIMGATSPGLERVDEVVVETMRGLGIPGASLAVARNGALVLAKGYGWADRHARVALNPDTLFALASVSKSLTAVTILKLVEAGRLGLDAHAFELLADIEPLPGDHVDPRVKQVTVRQLLYHTGGWDRDKSGDPNGFSQRVATRMQVPLPVSPRQLTRSPNEAHRYGPNGQEDREAGHLPITMASGGWLATPSEMVRFLTGLDTRHGSRFLSQESYAAMTAPPAHPVPLRQNGSHVGMGWDQVQKTPRGFSYRKNGGLIGVHSLLAHRDDGIDWALCWNGGRQAAEGSGAAPRQFGARVEEALESVTTWPNGHPIDRPGTRAVRKRGGLMRPHTWNFQEVVWRRDRSRLYAALALATIALSAYLFLRFLSRVRTADATISAGNTEGIWHQFLLRLAQEAPRGNFRIVAIVTDGTLDMLERVDRGELDFAIIIGGHDFERFQNVRQVAGLTVTPVHLLVKREHHPAVVRDLRELRGKTVNLGSGRRAAMYRLSQEILQFAGLLPAEFHPSVLTSEELRSEQNRDRLPDAIFIATTPPSELVRYLIVEQGYQLVPLPFGDAFRLSALAELDRYSAEKMVVRREHIADAEIPIYSYRVSPAEPPQTIPTLGMRALLITHRNTSATTVGRLLDAILSSRFGQTVQPPLDGGIVQVAPEAPWHHGTEEYRLRDKPLITGEMIGVFSNVLQIVLPAGGGILLVWGWLRNRILTRRERRFDRFIALVSGVERRAIELEKSTARDTHALQRLHRELSTIKDAALERIAVGEAGADVLVDSLFAHINDVRAYLGHLERFQNEPVSSQAENG